MSVKVQDKCVLNDCVLAGNSTRDAAAGSGGGASTCVLNNCIVKNNASRSGGAGWDYLLFAVDGEEQERIDGESAWLPVERWLGPGAHTLRWSYTKDEVLSSGDDCGWVDELACQTATASTPVPVPYAWLFAYPSLVARPWPCPRLHRGRQGKPRRHALARSAERFQPRFPGQGVAALKPLPPCPGRRASRAAPRRHSAVDGAERDSVWCVRT